MLAPVRGPWPQSFSLAAGTAASNSIPPTLAAPMAPDTGPTSTQDPTPNPQGFPPAASVRHAPPSLPRTPHPTHKASHQQRVVHDAELAQKGRVLPQRVQQVGVRRRRHEIGHAHDLLTQVVVQRHLVGRLLQATCKHTRASTSERRVVIRVRGFSRVLRFVTALRCWRPARRPRLTLGLSGALGL